MPLLTQWSLRHGVPLSALAELRALLTAERTDPSPSDPPPRSEAAVQQAVRLEASAKGCRLWRNNVGMAMDPRGVPVRFGLANDSAAMNKRIKSSDLIGVRPGGQILVRECKPEGWKFTGKDREKAQLKFIELIIGMGGDACFANREGTI